MKVRKKPIVVDAWQLDHMAYDVPEWVREAWRISSGRLVFDYYRWQVATYEGVMTAFDGDYLIKGVKGELYPCREDVFEETYEIVEEVE